MVAIVGFREMEGEPVWIVKNSFRIEWGNQVRTRRKRLCTDSSMSNADSTLVVWKAPEIAWP